jgi:hypothetical protein
MSGDAITALRRIASGMQLARDGGFTRMPRAQMIALARAACRAANASFGAKPAWRGEMPPVVRKPRKVKLSPRIEVSQPENRGSA